MLAQLLGVMRCPVCGSRMTPSQSKEEIFVDPSGHGVYVCHGRNCPGAGNEPMVYRRVMQGVEQRKSDAQLAAEQTHTEQLALAQHQNARLNELTSWLRDKYPGYFRGQFRDQIDIAIFVMTGGKDDRSIKASDRTPVIDGSTDASIDGGKESMARRNPELEKRALELAKLMGVDPDQIMDLAELGVEEVDTTVYPRLIVSSASKEKKGKTHFSVHTTPSPVLLVDFDIGTEGVVNKTESGRVILHKQFNLAARAALEERKVARDEWEEEWTMCRRIIKAGISSPLIRTIVVDTASEMWELSRLSEFGKLDQVKSHHYGPLNREFRQLVQSVYSRRNLNAIFTHKVKKEYVDDKTTGKYERAGFGDMPFLVQCNIEHFKTVPQDELYNESEGPEFGIRVINCRQNPEVDGQDDFVGSRCSFKWLGRAVFPDSKKGDWE